MRQHRNERNYQCSECGATFITKGQLKKHHIAKHVANNDVECPVCGKVVKEWYMKRHSATHNKERARPHK